jgi:hypothetical protein
MPAQLHLFKGKRQRGVKLPAVDEFKLHCIVADVLTRWCSNDWTWTHFPAGEYRTPATAGRLKRMGVQPGWPDFQFFHINGPVAFLELKRAGSRASDPQKAVAFRLIKAGHGYALCDDMKDVFDALHRWRVIPARISA